MEFLWFVGFPSNKKIGKNRKKGHNSGILTMRRELTQAGMPEPEEKLLRFCAVPRTRQEIAEFLGIKSVPYAIKTHVMPLVEQGRITLALPEKCSKSPKQRYTTKPQ